MRVTIPEGTHAIILPSIIAQDIFALAMELRKSKIETHRGIASDLVMALLEAGVRPS